MHPDSVHKTTGAYLAFVKDVPKSARKKILAGCPSPINGYAAWGDRLLSIETEGDSLEWELCETYGTERDKAKPFPEVTVAMMRAFTKDANEWILKVHKEHPLLFAIGPGVPKEGDAWEEDSQARFTQLLVEFLSEYTARNQKDLEEDNDSPTDTISKGHIACILQYLPESVPKALRPKAKALQKKFPL